MDEKKSNNIDTIIGVMSEQQAIEDKAWQIFKESYEREVPPPVLEPKPEKHNHWIYRVMLAGLVGALIVSGLQTIPAFYVVMIEAGLPIYLSAIGGFSAFVAVDLVMFSASHYLVQTQWRLRAKTNEQSFKNIEQFIKVAQWFGFIVSIGSNFYFVFFAYQVNTYVHGLDTGITITVAILIALAPAIQGLAIGSVIAALPITDEIESIRINRRNRESMQDYNDKMRLSWNKRKSKYGVKDMDKRIERLQDTHENMYQDTIQTVSDSLRQSNSGQTLSKKVAIKLIQDNEIEYEDIAHTVLRQNPTANQRTIAEAIAIEMTGESTGYKTVIRAYKELGIDLF